MANLSQERIKELIKAPLRREQIEQAIRHENKLRLHTDTLVDSSEFGEPQKKFLEWVKCLLPSEIYARFETLFQPPFPTLELTESIFSELSRVFEGQNRFFKFEFKNSDYVEDFSDYRIELNDDGFWKQEAWEALQSRINSIVIVDLPTIQESELPKPYYYLLDINNLVDYKYDRKDNFEYIIVRDGENKFLYLDPTCYIRIEGDEQKTFTEVPHVLGYTPAKDFWRERRKRNSIDKKSPITKSIGELNWLLFFEVSKKYLDLYAPYPIYSAYESKCGFTNEFGHTCENGKIQINEGYSTCPSCHGKKIKIGVGSFVEVPVPTDGQSFDLRNPVQVLPAEITSLEYCRSEIKRLEQEIFTNCVGKGGESNNDQAQNEKQVRGAFESKINKLTQVKNSFEYIHKWVLDTVCIFRYGTDFINSTVNYGDITYLEGVSELNVNYSEAQRSGKPIFELANMRDRIYNTENKNNSDEKLRNDIKKALEPWQSLDLNSIKSLGLDVKFPEKFLLKINFDEYLQRFEREQTNILMFASNLSFDQRITRIKEVLMTYVNEEIGTVIPISEPFKETA